VLAELVLIAQTRVDGQLRGEAEVVLHPERVVGFAVEERTGVQGFRKGGRKT